MVENSVIAEIYNITNDKNKNWRNLLKLGKTLDLEERRKYLWMWPTEADLNEFKHVCKSLKIKKILSIGCGNGLLEWIIQQSVGISVYGLEIDKTWWTSVYAVKSFIGTNFIDENVANEASTSEFLKLCAHDPNWRFGLLFCYFNNHEAFNNYSRDYKGDWIIIIGPAPEVGIHTDPKPLEPDFPAETSWLLKSTLRFDDNIVAFYENMLKIK